MSLLTALNDELGYAGKLLSGSKTAYSSSHPNDIVWFNACIFDVNSEQIWFGDINLTEKNNSLQKIAETYGTFYVTTEQPFRWYGLAEGAKKSPNSVLVFFKSEEINGCRNIRNMVINSIRRLGAYGRSRDRKRNRTRYYINRLVGVLSK